MIPMSGSPRPHDSGGDAARAASEPAARGQAAAAEARA
jgi:hypothetical protein